MERLHPTQEICARIVELDFSELDAQTIIKAKEAMRDGLTVSAAGCNQQPVRILADYARSQAAQPVATVWGHGFKTSLASAALVNAASVHVLDYEPMSDPSTHVVSPVLPTVMALAESQRRSGRDIITACVKGFEIQHRILGAAVSAARTDRSQRQFHVAGVVGVMGSAVAAAHMLGLDATKLAHALGIAASRAGSLTANAGTMTKCVHTGSAAAAGLEAALWAAQGFDANSAILEDEKGYVAAFFSGGAFAYGELMEFGKPFRIVEPGMAFKFYPSKYGTQFAIGAALELRRQIGDVKNIERITITTPVMDDVDRAWPRSGLEGKFSFQYVTAAMLLDGTISIGSFSDASRFRPEIDDLLAKTRVVKDRNIPANLSKMHVVTEIETKDGRSYTAECRTPTGFWGIPIAREQHLEKMKDCLQFLSAAQMIEYVDLTDRFEALNAGDVDRVIGLLNRGPE